MKWIALATISGLAFSCGKPGLATDGNRVYENNDLQLATAYRAKEVCSCVFVMGMPDDFCQAWTVAAPNVATFTVDRAEQTVESSAFILWGARAHFVDGQVGCILE